MSTTSPPSPAAASAATSASDPATDRAHIATELERARGRTLDLVDRLTDAEQRAQVSPLMSPFVWDLAHIGNYEELWLLRELDGRAPIDPTLDDLYNAFEHPRWERPSLPILGPADALAYLERVREDVLDLLDRGFVYGMVLQHEHQHDETILATHQLRGTSALLPRPVPESTTTEIIDLAEPVTPDDRKRHRWMTGSARVERDVELSAGRSSRARLGLRPPRC